MAEDAPPPPPSPYYAPSSPSLGDGSGGRAPERYDEEDYREIYYHFDDYCQDVILSNASKFLTPPEPAEHYEWEEVLLDEASGPEWEGIKRSVYFGLGCGLLGLGALRWRRGGLRRGGSGGSHPTRTAGGYSFDPMPQGSHAMSHHPPLHTPPPGARGGLAIDLTLSAVLGAGVSLVAMQYDAFYPTAEPPPQWVSQEIPLVPGRSIIAETLCGPLTEEFRKFPKDLWRSGHNLGIEAGYNNHMALYANSGWKGSKYYDGNSNASVVGGSDDGLTSGVGTYERLLLDNLQGFVINCERRSQHERRLRKIRGLREGKAVLIPDGGVVCDEDLELDDIYLMDGEEGEGGDDHQSFGL
ncbi:hypothetical protein ACHAWF_011519 [Thalassiosira exigua]